MMGAHLLLTLPPMRAIRQEETQQTMARPPRMLLLALQITVVLYSLLVLLMMGQLLLQLPLPSRTVHNSG